MARNRIFDNITQTIGETPLVRLRSLAQGVRGEVLLKLESFNPYNSVKDRIGVAMVDEALRTGVLRPGMTIVEPTSGNTGIGIAFAAVAHGYNCIFTMPETMTVERRNMLRALNATVVLTEGARGMKGAIERAQQILDRLGDAGWMPRQFDNPANPEIHSRTTGPEIWEDTEGNLDALVAGVGTGGTLTGAGRFLRSQKPSIRIFAVEPNESPVLSGGASGPHKQQGIGPGFVPSVLDTSLYNEVIRVTNEDAIETTRRLAREEGILTGISSGSITWAALQVAARDEFAGKRIVAVLPDFGERYLSNPVYTDIPDPVLPDGVADLIHGSSRE